MASKKRSPYVSRLARMAKELSKASPRKVHRVLFDAFEIVAATGDVAQATTLIEWMYGRAPAPIEIASALSTHAIDGLCAAAKLGDRTAGLPERAPSPTRPATLAARVKAAEAMARQRLLHNAYGDEMPTDDGWQKMKPSPHRTIDRWRRVQALAASGKEKDALERLDALLEEWNADARGAGYGDELVLALDLALRNGEKARIPAWLERHGARFADESFLIQTALCLPAVAAFIARGGLREVMGLSDADVAAAMKALDAAFPAPGPSGSASAKTTPRVQKRRVSAEYSQLHVGPEAPTEAEKAQVHFQKETDSERGMSLFPTMVGIRTPTDTDYVDVEITLSSEKKVHLARVAQAVTFPLEVRGPLLLSSVSGDDGEPFTVPNGSYDVLARFVPTKAPKASTEAGLRVFTLSLSFHAARSLGAPKTLKMTE